MKVTFGSCELEVGGKYLIDELRDSSDCLGDPDTLRKTMTEEGYLFLRGLHDRDRVLTARREILEKLATAGELDPSADLMDGIKNPNDSSTATVTVRGKENLKDGPGLKNLVEGPEVMGFFERFLGGEVLTFDFKWLRAVGPGSGAAIHYDIVYMGRGTKNLYTCWTPLGSVSLEMGPLVLCLGSHRLEAVKSTYGDSDVDRDLSQGVFTNDPLEMVDRFGCKWATTEFQPGDAVILSMFMMHGSLVNTSNRLRLSVDTRYQRTDEPVDERWVGSKPITHTEFWKPDAKLEPLEDSRNKWGV